MTRSEENSINKSGKGIDKNWYFYIKMIVEDDIVLLLINYFTKLN